MAREDAHTVVWYLMSNPMRLSIKFRSGAGICGVEVTAGLVRKHLPDAALDLAMHKALRPGESTVAAGCVWNPTLRFPAKAAGILRREVRCDRVTKPAHSKCLNKRQNDLPEMGTRFHFTMGLGYLVQPIDLMNQGHDLPLRQQGQHAV